MIKTYPHNIFKILAAIILLGVIAAGYISWQRYNVEAHATTVEMVYDYNNILESASVESTAADELFSLYKRSGITSLAVYDETPKNLRIMDILQYIMAQSLYRICLIRLFVEIVFILHLRILLRV